MKLYDKSPTRHLTMPKIPYIRDRLEYLAGDLAEEHDAAYADGRYIKPDVRFILKSTGRFFLTVTDAILLGALVLFSGPAFLINHVVRRFWWKT